MRERPAIGLAQLQGALRDDLDVSTINFAYAVQQIAWRSKALGVAYPFAVTDTAFSRLDDARTRGYYQALLLLTSSISGRLGGQTPEGTSLMFERIVCAAMARFLGDGTQVLRFGWPYEDGRPDQFGEAIRWAAEKMRIRLGAGYRQPRRRDGGVDVIAWRPFPDSRPGFPIALVQCTIEEDVVGKSRDIDVGLWSSWLGFDTAPMCVLAVPSTVGRNEDWNEVAVNAVLLERLRLAWLCVNSGAPTPADVVAFVQTSVESLRVRLDQRR
jgi:hypothetical protein